MSIVGIGAPPTVSGAINLASFIANVKDYGARGDGIADDTIPIQNAMNAAAVSGGAVLLPPGQYAINSRLRLGAVLPPDNVLISGYGATIKPLATFPTGTQVFRLGDSGSGREATNLTVEGLKIDMSLCTGSTTIGIALFAKQRCTLRDVSVFNAPQHAFNLAGLAGTPTEILVDHCYAQDCQGNGFLFASNVSYSIIHDSGAKNINISQLGAGFYIFSGDNNTLDNCWCDTSGNNGFRIGTSNNTAINCRALNINGEGFRLTSSSGSQSKSSCVNCVVSGVYSGSAHAFRASGHTDGSFINCRANGATGGANGVRIDNLDGAVKGIRVIGCEFDAMQPGGGIGDGVNITSGTFHQIVGCTFKNMGRDGVHADNVTDVIVSGCISYDDQGTKTQAYAVRTTGTSDRFTIVGNSIRAADHLTGSTSLVGAANITANNQV